MKNCFWQQFKKPIYALAPMAGITDSAFRQTSKRFGADAVYSEMASVTALVYQPKKTLEMLRFSESERPYVVQLFGSDPEHFAQAARLVEKKLNPDGIDINFGCPVNKVIKQGAGAVLMDNLKLSKEIIKSVIANTDLPVSIKTRSRAGAVDALVFLDNVSDLKIRAVMIHGRSLKQGFSGPVDTEIIKATREYFGGIILANGGFGCVPGDAGRRQATPKVEAGEFLEKTGADGIGIAQGALGRPWIFKAVRSGQEIERSRQAVFKVAIEHAELAEKLKSEEGIKEMRKHLCWYVAGLPGARQLRQELVKVGSLDEVRFILK